MKSIKWPGSLSTSVRPNHKAELKDRSKTVIVAGWEWGGGVIQWRWRTSISARQPALPSCLPSVRNVLMFEPRDGHPCR